MISISDKILDFEKENNCENEMGFTEVYGDSAIGLSAMKYGIAEFERGLTSIFNEDLPSTPNEVANPELIDKYGIVEFERCLTNIFNEDQPNTPNEVTNPELIDKVHDIGIKDRRLKVRDITESVSISIEWMQNLSIIY